MECPVCKGTGVMQLPHVPGARGGWLDTSYNFSGMECGACNGTGVRLESTEAAREKTADEQLEEFRIKLRVAFECSPCFPDEMMQKWGQVLDEFDVWEPARGLMLVDEFEQALAEAKSYHTPSRDIFSMSPGNEYQLERHCSEIKACFGQIRLLMEHARRFLAKHPNGV